MKKKIVCVLIISYFLCINITFCISSHGKPGYYLDILSSRALSLTASYIAFCDDSATIFLNPAGLTNFHQKEMSMSSAFLYENSFYRTLHFALPINFVRLNRFTIGLGCNWLNSPKIEKRDENNYPAGYATDNHSVFVTGVAFEVKPKFTIGSSFIFVHRTFDEMSCSGYGANIGSIWSLSEDISFKIGIKNLLPIKLKYKTTEEIFPMELDIGALFSSFDFLSMGIGLQWLPAYRNGLSFGIGTEFKLILPLYRERKKQGIILRCGYESSKFTPGFSIIYKDITFDYTVSNEELLGLSHMGSFSIRFGADRYQYFAKSVSEKKYKHALEIIEKGNISKAIKILKEAKRIDIYNKEVNDLLTKLIKVKRDEIPPEVKVLIPSAKTFIVNKDSVEIKWQVVDNLLVSSVSVNQIYEPMELKDRLSGFCSFQKWIKLQSGKNKVEIVAYDMNGNRTTETLEVVYDDAPPKILRVSPGTNTTKAKPFVAKNLEIEVRCYVKDEITEIEYVEISGMRAERKTKDEFVAHLYLLEGLNEIEITAKDIAGNIARTTIYISLISEKKSTSIDEILEE
ncbi:MAG: hypothetical protein ABDH23_05985 [Endomicrobiia bacterium]